LALSPAAKTIFQKKFFSHVGIAEILAKLAILAPGRLTVRPRFGSTTSSQKTAPGGSACLG
jgi:hypothetical protein